MIYSENFKKILEKYPSAYIGCGNPGAKILIIGKEAALDLQTDQNQHRLEISSNAGQWRENIKNQTGFEDVGRWCDGKDYNPLYPYKGQRFAIERGKNNGGTSVTWYNYQKVVDAILGREHPGEIDFFEHCFITEFNENSAKKSSGRSASERQKVRQSIGKRTSMFKEEAFFQDFPIVIAACGPYVDEFEISLENTFSVKKLTEEGMDIKPRKDRRPIDVYGVYRSDKETAGVKKLLIHANQLSMVSEGLIEKISKECRSFMGEGK